MSPATIAATSSTANRPIIATFFPLAGSGGTDTIGSDGGRGGGTLRVAGSPFVLSSWDGSLGTTMSSSWI